jgi:hypothetical protein
MTRPERKSLTVKPDRFLAGAERGWGERRAVYYNKKRLTESGQATVMDCSKLEWKVNV